MTEFDGTRTAPFDLLTGRDTERPLTFADILAQPEPEWARPQNAAAFQAAQLDAEDVYRRAFNPNPLDDVIVWTHLVYDDIEAALGQMQALIHEALRNHRPNPSTYGRPDWPTTV